MIEAKWLNKAHITQETETKFYRGPPDSRTHKMQYVYIKQKSKIQLTSVFQLKNTFKRENTIKLLAINVKYHLSCEYILDLYIDQNDFNL